VGGMNYVECDVPAGMTLLEWRRARRLAAPTRRRRSARALLRLGVAREPEAGGLAAATVARI
jgi:hypothetical protein